MLLRHSFDLILNSSQYLCPRHVRLAFTYFLTFSRSLHPTTFITDVSDTVTFLSGQVAFANISASSTFFAPIRFYCAHFIHRLTSHPPTIKKRPILASFISWIYARLLFNKRLSFATALDRSTSDFCQKWQFCYCRRYVFQLRKILHRIQKSLRFYLYCESNSFTVE